MEEILASIRKIIEDTDQGHQQAAAPAGQPAAMAAAAPVPEPVEDIAPAPDRAEPDLDAFREAISGAETQAARAETTVPAPADDARPFTLADVQRRLESTQPRAAEPAPAPVEEPVLDIEEDNADLPVMIDDEPAAEIQAEARAIDLPLQPFAASAAHEGQRNRPSIISDAAGRQVAGAFDELKEAFMASRQKGFDEMAEEMMRPMLQDWLDNNLPVLVERLVREEIERIARG